MAEDLDAATAVARRYRYRFRIVTLDGQVVNAGGSLTGGSLARNSGLLSRASEIERIRAQADQLREQAEQAAAALRAANEEASAAEAALTGAKGELATAQEERIRIEAEHNRAKADRQTIAADIAALEQESTVAAGRLEEQRAIQKQAEQKLGEATLQISVLQGKMNEIRSGRSEQNQLSDTLSNQLQELRIESLSAQKDIESLRATIADIERRKEDRAGHVAGLRQEMERVQDSIVSLQTRIEELKKEAASLREQAKASTARIEELNAQRMAFEKKSAELRAKEREQSSARENVGHELARLEERKASLQKEYDEIISRLWEEYELTRREAEEVAAPIEDVGQSQKRLNELKGKIKALGTVNVAAVEEYKEVSERYAFMNAQVADVEQSRDELKRLIGDLTRQMRELFIERFKQINTNFLQTFQELFGGGTANLSLTDPEDILHSRHRDFGPAAGQDRHPFGIAFRRRKGIGGHCAVFCHYEGQPAAVLHVGRDRGRAGRRQRRPLCGISAAHEPTTHSSLSSPIAAAPWRRRTSCTASPCRMKAFPSFWSCGQVKSNKN